MNVLGTSLACCWERTCCEAVPASGASRLHVFKMLCFFMDNLLDLNKTMENPVSANDLLIIHQNSFHFSLPFDLPQSTPIIASCDRPSAPLCGMKKIQLQPTKYSLSFFLTGSLKWFLKSKYLDQPTGGPHTNLPSVVDFFSTAMEESSVCTWIIFEYGHISMDILWYIQ